MAGLFSAPSAPEMPAPPPPAPTAADDSVTKAAEEEQRLRANKGRASTILTSFFDTTEETTPTAKRTLGS